MGVHPEVACRGTSPPRAPLGVNSRISVCACTEGCDGGADLGDEDGFADYDEDADMPVSIMELEWKLEAVSAK